MIHPSVSKFCLALAIGLALNNAAQSAGTESTPRANASIDDFAQGKKAIDEKRWSAAIEHFNKVVAKDKSNADAYNFLGYSYRWLNRMDESLASYKQALTLNPKHLGANEYLGQAYLKMGDKPKAQDQLAKLKEICGNCKEAQDLSGAVAAAN